jgi:hypothetical protein
MSIRSKHVCVFLLKSWLPRINNNLDYRYNHSDVAIAWLPRLTIPEIAFALCHNWFLRGRYSLIARDSISGRLFTRSFFRVARQAPEIVKMLSGEGARSLCVH